MLMPVDTSALRTPLQGTVASAEAYTSYPAACAEPRVGAFASLDRSWIFRVVESGSVLEVVEEVLCGIVVGVGVVAFSFAERWAVEVRKGNDARERVWTGVRMRTYWLLEARSRAQCILSSCEEGKRGRFRLRCVQWLVLRLARA